MSKSVSDTTDKNQIEDATQSEFADYMARNYGKVRPGSALWQLYAKERASDQARFVKATSVVEELYPELQCPRWAEEEETRNCVIPALSKWVSAPLRVLLRSEWGYTNEGVNTLALAHLDATLMRTLIGTEPYIQVTHHANPHDAANALEKLDTIKLTLSEAAELAHGLLLLLDIATEVDA
ncbi:hypothetical protein [Rhodococcus sp. UNC23MFCrub1.1]|uniref:hypothetical protein n=1 Tax=Rhodococcus sp. UNC23MFCrub1.1 TaxID=1449068 RepID=UPI000A4E1CCA|nr:hypothetical protein [Rhodococcus sp. UNC23MFCrub1.1]